MLKVVVNPLHSASSGNILVGNSDCFHLLQVNSVFHENKLLLFAPICDGVMDSKMFVLKRFRLHFISV